MHNYFLKTKSTLKKLNNIKLNNMALSLNEYDRYVLNLPIDAVILICKYLEDKDVLQMGQSCTLLYRIICNNVIWRYFCKKKWSIDYTIASHDGPNEWKYYYTKRMGLEIKMGRFKNEPWFLGDLSRSDAEQYLKECDNGVFLVRESINRPGEYALSVRNNSNTVHYKISCHYRDGMKMYYLNENHKVNNLYALVEYFQASYAKKTTLIPFNTFLRNGTDQYIFSMSYTPSSEVYIAIYDYEASDPMELDLYKGQAITLITKDTGFLGWWLGDINGQTGLFFSKHVQITCQF